MSTEPTPKHREEAGEPELNGDSLYDDDSDYEGHWFEVWGED